MAMIASPTRVTINAPCPFQRTLRIPLHGLAVVVVAGVAYAFADTCQSQADALRRSWRPG